MPFFKKQIDREDDKIKFSGWQQKILDFLYVKQYHMIQNLLDYIIKNVDKLNKTD